MMKRLRALGSSTPRIKIFVWAIIIAGICGALEVAEPAEDVLKATRDLIRAQPASGDIAVIGVDEKTGRELGRLEVERRTDAKMLDALFAMGVRRVFFDKIYADKTNELDDRAFVDALRRHKGKIFLGAMGAVEGQMEEVLPLPAFRAEAEFRSAIGKPQPFSLGATLPISMVLDGRRLPSLSAEMANYRGDGMYRPDWSIRMASIPTYSYADVLKGHVRSSAFRGRDVIIAPTAASLRDVYRVPFQGRQPGVYYHVIGAETLKKGHPAALGWLPGFALAAGASGYYLASRKRLVREAVAAGAAAALMGAPLLLNALLVDVDVLPALLLLSIVVYRARGLRKVETAERSHPTTKLPNLVALADEDGRPGSLVAVKVRNFPQIATSFEKSVESVVFKEIERRVRVAGTAGTVFHGEDCLLWFEQQPLSHELVNHLQGLHKLLTQPLRIEDREVDLLVAFGLDVDEGRPLASRLASVMLSAEEAAQANDVWKVYDAQRLGEAAWELSLMGRLGTALENGEVWVAYQPKVDLATRRIIGAEALVRWNHPSAGAISPDKFVPVAEAHNRIADVTDFVLKRAIQDLAVLRSRGHLIGVAVNLSPRLLLDEDLVSRVTGLLEDHAVPREALTLEVTETSDFLSSPMKIAVMEALAATGIRISIDDYGTGNATLEYLTRLPSQEVKIDRTFISDMDQNEQNMLVVRSTLDMAHKLGRKVVAEGVENEPVMAILRELGCDVAQGYLLSKPVPFEELGGMLQKETPLQKRRLVIS